MARGCHYISPADVSVGNGPARSGDPRLALDVQSTAGNLHHAKGRFEDARASYQRALDGTKGVIPDDHLLRSQFEALTL